MTAGVGCAVLAAGASRRLGFSKQLLRYEGAPLVRRVAECGLRSRASETLVVVGAQAKPVRRALGGLALTLRENASFEEGLASSVRVAALWAIERELDALLLALCDQPLLTTEHLDALIGVHERTGMVVASRYAGRCAVPALFPARLVPALLALRGEHGARELLRAERPIAVVPWPEGELDIDTRAQADALLGRQASDAPERRGEAS